MRIFCRYIRRYGADALLRCLARNEAAGVVYHRTGVWGTTTILRMRKRCCGLSGTGNEWFVDEF